jgi:type IV fimbrial biogenesis protein FimT
MQARAWGFTLVEVIVALAIASMLIAMGVPAFHDWLESYRLANHTQHVAQTMTRARTEAVRRGDRVNICASVDRAVCVEGASWAGGFGVFVDTNRNGQVDPGELVLGSDGPAPSGTVVSANRPLEQYVSYTDSGHARMLSGALQMGTFTLCRRGQRAMRVVLAHSGRVRMERTADRCP